MRTVGAALLLSHGAPAIAAENDLFGIWGNPRDSVHVEILSCGQALCGVVVWANDEAKADAREGGTDPLVGINLLRDFAKGGEGYWRGKVFVPDRGQTVPGTLALIGADSIRARSCVLGVFCRTQLWTRVR